MLDQKDMEMIAQLLDVKLDQKLKENNEVLRAEMRENNVSLKKEIMTEVSVLHESLVHDYIKPLYDKIMDIDRRLPDMEKVEDHDHRIWALEQAHKDMKAEHAEFREEIAALKKAQ